MGKVMSVCNVSHQEKWRPVVEKLVAAAQSSTALYENFAGHMTLPPLEFAMSYLMRSDRIDRNRLAKMSPEFPALCEKTHRRT